MTPVVTNIFLAWQQSPRGRVPEVHTCLAVGLRYLHEPRSLHWPGYPTLLHIAVAVFSCRRAGALSLSIGILRLAIHRESSAFEVSTDCGDPNGSFCCIPFRTPTRPTAHKGGKFFQRGSRDSSNVFERYMMKTCVAILTLPFGAEGCCFLCP